MLGQAAAVLLRVVPEISVKETQEDCCPVGVVQIRLPVVL